MLAELIDYSIARMLDYPYEASQSSDWAIKVNLRISIIRSVNVINVETMIRVKEEKKRNSTAHTVATSRDSINKSAQSFHLKSSAKGPYFSDISHNLHENN